MNSPAWLALFAESEPQATVDLLPDPERFISRANEICEQLESYVRDHKPKLYILGPAVRVLVLDDAMRLNGCLISLKARAEHPERYLPEARSLVTAAPELIERWEAFLIEGGSELIPGQTVLSVSRWRRDIAAKNRRVQLPKRAVMCAMDDGCQTPSEVENFLLNESNLTDGWGAFDIDAEIGAFILTDTVRNFTERTLQVTRISKLISEIKERYSD